MASFISLFKKSQENLPDQYASLNEFLMLIVVIFLLVSMVIGFFALIAVVIQSMGDWKAISNNAKGLMAFFMLCGISFIILREGFGIVPKIGWEQSLQFTIISIINCFIFIWMIIKLLAFFSKKEKIGKNWVLIPLYMISLLGVGLLLRW